METTTVTAKPTTTDNAIKLVSAIFGTAHFILQSAADLTANAEGNIVHKLSKGEITKQEVIDNRKNSTVLKQQKVLDKIAEIKAKAKKQD